MEEFVPVGSERAGRRWRSSAPSVRQDPSSRTIPARVPVQLRCIAAEPQPPGADPVVADSAIPVNGSAQVLVTSRHGGILPPRSAKPSVRAARLCGRHRGASARRPTRRLDACWRRDRASSLAAPLHPATSPRRWRSGPTSEQPSGEPARHRPLQLAAPRGGHRGDYLPQVFAATWIPAHAKLASPGQ